MVYNTLSNNGKMDMIKITNEIIDSTIVKARNSPRKRANYNFHKSYSDPIQRLINALEPGTYIRPHKHADPDKTEVFIILKGRAIAVEFDDRGEVIDHIILDPRTENKGVEIPPGKWHSFIALEKDSALYEIKDGPFTENNDKNFATWAPPEGAKEAQEFNQKIMKALQAAGTDI